MKTPSNYALRLPASLKKTAQAAAREDGSTLNQFIVTAVAEKLAALKTAEYFADRAARGDKSRALRFLRRNGGEAPRKGDERG
ncbi:MAG: toxin-antitoxin system HicB family antitoxin [Proteobacteria bacterium]|nr:toxin-antitoxin system HicB family antitoxin [Pseudomonadota bacterium]